MPFDGYGPIFLARTAPTAPAPRPVNAWPTYYAHFTARAGGMRSTRWSWWAHWARCAEFILPYRYKYLVTANSFSRGGPINDRIIDETALLAMQICAKGLMSGLMSGSWFQLGVGLPWFQPDAEAREWLEDTEERIYTVLAESNWYTTWAQAFGDVSTFGTAPLLISEDYEDVIRCYLPCAGEYYLGLGGRLSVDTFYREFTYTVSQLVDRFGLENCPEEVQRFWNIGGASLEREFVVIHAIEPNFPLAPRSAPRRRGYKDAGQSSQKLYLVPSSFPWRSVYWLRGYQTAAPLEAKGEHEQPFCVAGWARTSNDPYCRGPGMDALAATKQLQHEQERKGEFIDKGVRPPMGGHPQLQNKPASILPGELTFVNTANGEKGFWPLFEVNPAHLQPMVEDIKEVQNRINRCFLIDDVWLPISRMEGVQPRNELELMERRGEKIQQAGPIVELFETETLPLALKRVVAIMQRRRMIKPLPQSLQGKPVTIEYRSTLKLLLRAGETAAIERGIQLATKMDESAIEARQAGYDVELPSRIVKLEDALRKYYDRIGFPLKSVYSVDEVAKMDAARAKAKAFEQATKATEAAVKAGEGASNIDVGGGQNVISAMLGRPGGGAQASP